MDNDKKTTISLLLTSNYFLNAVCLLKLERENYVCTYMCIEIGRQIKLILGISLCPENCWGLSNCYLDLLICLLLKLNAT